MTTLKRQTLVPWPALGEQFGAAYRHQRQFRWNVKQALARVQDAWPELRAEARLRGLMLWPDPPSVRAWAIRR